LDLFVARARTAWDLLVAAGYLLLGRERQTPAIDHYAVYDSVWIDSKDAAAVQGDGESLGMTPVLVELVPTALTVITP
jgi:diacylglycerol kinase family enzyme